MSAGTIVTRLFASLRAAGCEATATELADILWLAHYVPANRTSPRPAPADATAATGTPATTAVSSDSEKANTQQEPVSTATPPATQQPSAGLFTQIERPPGPTRRASIVRAPGAPALPNALALSRALRPLLKKKISRRRWQLDEEATADATALNNDIATPVFRPGAERWFEVALVIDDSVSMHVWKQAMSELRRLLVRHGGFRDLRQYRLRVGVGTNARIDPDPGTGGPSRINERDAVELISESDRRLRGDAISDPSGQRLIVLVSDAVSPMWRELPLRRMLFAWARFSPVVLLDVLPRRMWPHTAVGFGERLMQPRHAGAPNVDWWTERDWWEAIDAGRVLPLPVMALDANQFARWARSLMQVSADQCTGTLISVDRPPLPATVSTSTEPATALERVQQFRSVASAPAYQLACYFSATHLVLPVLRIVQRKMMPATGPSHLAEFLLSGLIRRVASAPGSRATVTDADAADASEIVSSDPEKAAYDFHPGVREILLDQLDTHEVPQVAVAIEEYLTEHLGESYDLRALILDDRGEERISAEALPFVQPALELLARISGRPPRETRSVFDRLIPILYEYLGRERVDAHIGREVRVVRTMPEDEQRRYLQMVAIELMPDEQRERLLPLCVTEPGARLPAALWQRLFDESDVRMLLLIDGIEKTNDDRLKISPEVHRTLHAHVTSEQIQNLHERIVNIYFPSSSIVVPNEDDGYFYAYVVKHLAAARRDEQAESLLLDREWIARKVQFRSVAEFIDDLDRFPNNADLKHLRKFATMSFARWEDPYEWAESLLAEWSGAHDLAEVEPPTAEPERAAAVVDVDPDAWVLVVGTGGRRLIDFERDVATAVGVMLADHDYGLMIGDWPGVDSIVADSYLGERRRLGRSAQGQFLRFVSSRDKEAGLPADQAASRTTDQVMRYSTDDEYRDRAFAQADAVVLIGGVGFTRKTGLAAVEAFLPVIPIAATGSDAAFVFSELVKAREYSPDDALDTNGRFPEHVQMIAERVRELLKGTTPAFRLGHLSLEYLESQDLERTARIEARVLALLRRSPGLPLTPLPDQITFDRLSDARALLRACAYRVWPEPELTADLLTDHRSIHVVLQRLRALEQAFERLDTRHNLPEDTPSDLHRISQRVRAEPRTPVAEQATWLLENRLLPLGELMTMAAAATSPEFDNLALMVRLAGDVLSDAMGVDCLADLHPGWRLVGLARLISRPLGGLASRIVNAGRFEATFDHHIRAVVLAINAMVGASLSIELDPVERATLDRFRALAGPNVSITSMWHSQNAAMLASLVRQYHTIRREQASGPERTTNMEAVFAKMRDVVTGAEGFDVLERLADPDRGWRLAAYAFAQKRKDPALFAPVCRSLIEYRSRPGPDREGSNDNRPFGEYHALVALEKTDLQLAELSDEQRTLLIRVRDTVRVGADTDRGTVLSRVLSRHPGLTGVPRTSD